MTHGLLLVPEDFSAYPSPYSPREDKKRLLAEGSPMFRIPQVRACFTLSSLSGLYRPPDGSVGIGSHASLFGEFSIGIDPINASQLGILPTIYYTDYDKCGGPTDQRPLSAYLVDRLLELRTLIAVLSHIEALAEPNKSHTFTRGELEEMGIRVEFENAVVEKLDRLDEEGAQTVFGPFLTDRVPMWNLAESLDLVLSLFQSTHSRGRRTPLAYYQQREWRLIQHNTELNKLYSLGERSWVDRPDAAATNRKKAAVRRSLASILAHARYLRRVLKGCWVLEAVDGRPFRDYISEVVVPNKARLEAEATIKQFPFSGEGPRVVSFGEIRSA